MTTSAETELNRLYQLDYGDRIELVLRFGSIFVAGTLYWFYTSEYSGFIWLAGFFSAHVLCVLQLKLALAAPSLRMLNVAVLLNALILVAYLWLPLRLVFVDDVVLRVGGLSAVVAMALFVLRRSDTLIAMVVAQSIVGVAAVVFMAGGLVAMVDGLFAQVCVLFCLSMMAVYFVIAVVKSRQLRLEYEAAAAQAAQEQKLASIGRLAGGVAHDFNNALTGISGNLELYFELDDQDEREELLRIAQGAAQRAAHLVNQLLVFSRKSGIQRRRVDVEELIDEVAAFQRRLLPANITLRTLGQAGLAVDVDKNLVVTALINLTVNAVDAMPDGGALWITGRPKVTNQPIRCVDGRILPPGRYACLAVADTGHGIPREILSRIVEPFFSTKPAGKGSGLGLSMVVGLVHSLDGGVDIETGPEGTKVGLLIPDRSAERPPVSAVESLA